MFGLLQNKVDPQSQVENEEQKYITIDSKIQSDSKNESNNFMQIEEPLNSSKIYQLSPEEIIGFFVFRSEQGQFKKQELHIFYLNTFLVVELEPKQNDLRFQFTCDIALTFNFSMQTQQGVLYTKNFSEKVELLNNKTIVIDDVRPHQNEEIIIKFEVDFRQYISDSVLYKNFGQRGIINEGNTCYMNCLLQLLSHLDCFKKVLYGISQLTMGKFPASLQELFHQLGQSSSSPVKITPLLRSFDWNIDDALVQHDVQEFFLMLIDALDTKLRNIHSDTTETEIMKIFNGSYISEIQCLNVDEISRKEEVFTDIALEVKGLSCLEDSLKKYFQPEQMRGDNIFQSERYGKQEAVRVNKIKKLPPVLIFHLKRFSFEGGQLKKILDRYEYPEILNYFGDEEVYHLYGILQHRGEAINAGHYVAYIKDFKSKNWVSFNDQTVRVVSKLDAVDGNFGQREIIGEYNNQKKLIVERTTVKKHCAYMLVYVSQKHHQEIFSEIKQEDIPDWIRKKDEQIKLSLNIQKTKKTQIEISIIKYQNLKPFVPFQGLIFSKLAKKQILDQDQIEKQFDNIQHLIVNHDLIGSFGQLLTNYQLDQGGQSNTYFYRALLDQNDYIYGELLIHADLYKDIKLDVIKNALDNQLSKPAIILFDRKSNNKDDILIFPKMIQNNQSVKVLDYVYADGNQQLHHLIKDIIQSNPELTVKNSLLQDSFFKIHKTIDLLNQSLKQIKQEIGSQGSHLNLLFIDNKDFLDVYDEMTQLPTQFCVFEDKSQLLGYIYPNQISTYQDIITQLKKFVAYDPDLMLIKYWSNNQWMEVDYTLIMLLNEQKLSLVEILSQDRNELFLQKHMVPFERRIFVESYNFELLSGNPNNIKIFPASIECRKEDLCSVVIGRLLEQHWQIAYDIGLDPKINKLVIVQKAKDQNYIHHVIAFEKVSGWSMTYLERFRFQISEGDLQQNKLLIICNYRVGQGRYDDSMQPFWLNVSINITVEELIFEIKQVLPTVCDYTKLPRQIQFWVNSEQTINGKNNQKLNDDLKYKILTDVVEDFQSKIYVDIEILQKEKSQELRLNVI